MTNFVFWRRPATFLAAVAALAIPMMARAQTLKVGDPAPPLTVAKWVKGDKVERFEKDKIYVVEFWATWCPPCRASIPYLTELQKKNPDVKIIGVSIWETNSKVVEPFVAKMGDQMAYTVAMDSVPKERPKGEKREKGAMAVNWMQAGKLTGIPAAFVVQDGKIAWMGHPGIALEIVVAQAKAGKIDLEAVKTQTAEREAVATENDPIMGNVNKLLATNPKAALIEFDKKMAANPTLAKDYSGIRFDLLLRSDVNAAYDYASEMFKGDWKNDSSMLNNASWLITDRADKLPAQHYDLALVMAKRAVALLKRPDPFVLDTMAHAYYKKGDKKNAVATQKKALALTAITPAPAEQIQKDMEESLAQFEKMPE